MIKLIILQQLSSTLFFSDFHLSAGQIIDTFSSTDEFDCGLRCLRNQHCRSYNSKDTGDDIHEKTICQLSNQTRRTAPDFFKPTSGFTYFEKGDAMKQCFRQYSIVLGPLICVRLFHRQSALIQLTLHDICSDLLRFPLN